MKQTKTHFAQIILAPIENGRRQIFSLCGITKGPIQISANADCPDCINELAKIQGRLNRGEFPTA